MKPRILWNLVAAAAAITVGHATRSLTRAGWRSVRRKDPPLNPASPKTTWTEALLWTGLSSLVVGLARLMARRGAASLWKSQTGRFPRKR